MYCTIIHKLTARCAVLHVKKQLLSQPTNCQNFMEHKMQIAQSNTHRSFSGPAKTLHDPVLYVKIHFNIILIYT